MSAPGMQSLQEKQAVKSEQLVIDPQSLMWRNILRWPASASSSN